jgi:hypothetical protein
MAGDIHRVRVVLMPPTGLPVLLPARFHRTGTPDILSNFENCASIAIFYTPDTYVSIPGDTDGYLLFKRPDSCQFSFRSVAEQLNRSSGKV